MTASDDGAARIAAPAGGTAPELSELAGLKRRLRADAGAHHAAALALSHDISDRPELGFAEHYAAERICALLERHGFAVQRPAGGLDTAFAASAGEGDLVVGICAEYDALPFIGHACGHNVISGAAVLAGLTLRPHLADLGIGLRILGTPAEEGGGGKISMLAAGVFDGLHAVLMVHPAPHDLVTPSILAMAMLDVRFDGFTPASMHPEQGRSAGDAVTLTQVAVALLRQHLTLTDRLSGCVLEEGSAPNVLPARARLRYCLRAADMARLIELEQRFRDCVAGAALASGTQAQISEPHPRYDTMRHDAMLAALYRDNAVALGRCFPDVGQDDQTRSASSDFGNVSQRVPAIHPLIGIQSGTASNHQAAFTEYCRGESGDRAVADAGLALAWTIADLALRPECRSRFGEDA
jgi:amidohydrolase